MTMMVKYIDEVTKEIGKRVEEEVERRVREWIVSAKGTDFDFLLHKLQEEKSRIEVLYDRTKKRLYQVEDDNALLRKRCDILQEIINNE